MVLQSTESRVRAQVNVMQKHADMLGTVLEQAKEGWLSKNDPEFVAGRKRMLQSYLRAALRFADHHAVEEQTSRTVVDATTTQAPSLPTPPSLPANKAV